MVIVVELVQDTLPETNSLHLEMDGWKTRLVSFWDGLFWGAMLVSGRVGVSKRHSYGIAAHCRLDSVLAFATCIFIPVPPIFYQLQHQHVWEAAHLGQSSKQVAWPLGCKKQNHTWCEACCHEACVDMTMAPFTSRVFCRQCPPPPRTLSCVNSFRSPMNQLQTS